jgi:hypothetical protein
MTVVLFVTHFLKRKNSYTFLFSTAISEGIKEMFKEMGYSPERISKKENVEKDLLLER